MSGEIVERRDQVLMTGGLCPPLRTFSTTFRMLLSMKGPFFTERAIYAPSEISEIRNFKFEILIWSFGRAESSSACVCYCAFCNRELVGPMGLLDSGHQKSFLHHHHADDPQDSSRLHEHAVECPSNVIVRPCRKKHSRARCYRPDLSSLCKLAAPVESHPTAYAAVRSYLLSRRAEQRPPPSEPSVHLYQAAIRCCESAYPAEY